VTRERKRVANVALEALPLKPEHVAVINDALYGVTQSGTSRAAFAGADYQSGGKTGTAQAVGLGQNEKYNAAKIDEHRRDHSLYIAFAPLDAPTIALAVIVENAGFGSLSAAPIARRVFDYMLRGVYPSEQDIALTQQGQTTAPVGKPRPVASVPLTGATGSNGVAALPAGASSSGVMP
jgi:penicillin-binding protein 2